jgi:hypothetical protein
MTNAATLLFAVFVARAAVGSGRSRAVERRGLLGAALFVALVKPATGRSPPRLAIRPRCGGRARQLVRPRSPRRSRFPLL